MPRSGPFCYHCVFCSASGGAVVSLGFRDDARTAPAACLGHIQMPDERDPFLARSLQYMQENVRRAGPAASASYTLIGAILVLGGIGLAVDRWQGTAPWFLFGGLVLGMVVGFYELARTMWKL